MTDNDLELDAFYVRQIAFWLRKSEECDKEMLFWERKRLELRSKND